MNFKKAILFLLVATILSMATAEISLLAADDSAAAETKCPNKVPVVLETVKLGPFMEFMYFTGQGQAEILVVKSPVAGLLSEVKVSEGSLVDPDQELLVIKTGTDNEIKKLEAAVAQAKKILNARQNWKEKSEKAIQSADKSYQEALQQLNEKKAQVIKAPVAGIIRKVMAVGSETVVDALLLEISNPRQMVFQMTLTDAEQGSLASGDKFIGTTDNSGSEVEAEVIGVSEGRVTFKVNNHENQVKEGVIYTFKKLKAEHAEAITIPSEVIQKDSLGDFVYVAEKNKAKKLYVTLGAATNGRTMVIKGLTANDMLVVSGLECLSDGKRIKMVNREELAKEKAEAQIQKKERQEEQAEKKAAESEIKAEKAEQDEPIVQPGKKSFIVGLTFERFTINDKNLREFYSNWFQHIPGLEFSYQALEKVDVWASFKYYSDKQITVFYEDTVRFTLLPFSLGLRFRPKKFGSFEPFIGTGFNVYYYAETITGESELENTSGLAFGFHFQGGTYFYFSRSFLKNIFQKHNRSLLGEIFVKYNIVNKTLSEMTPDQTDKLDLGGFEMGIGLAVKF